MDLPDRLDSNARVRVKKNGTDVRERRGLDFIEGDNVTLTVADNPAGEKVDVTVAVSGLDSGDLSDFVEAAQDAVGGALTDSSTIDFTYTDGSDQITAAVIDGSLGRGKLADEAFTSYTPEMRGSSSDPNIGDGSAAGVYAVIHNLLVGYFVVTFGTSGTSFGSGTYGVTLPAEVVGTSLTPIMRGIYFDASTSDQYDMTGDVNDLGASVLTLRVKNASGTYVKSANLTPTVPVTIANSDQFRGWFIAEVA